MQIDLNDVAEQLDLSVVEAVHLLGGRIILDGCKNFETGFPETLRNSSASREQVDRCWFIAVLRAEHSEFPCRNPCMLGSLAQNVHNGECGGGIFIRYPHHGQDDVRREWDGADHGGRIHERKTKRDYVADTGT
jgi:hypothetical protein